MVREMYVKWKPDAESKDADKHQTLFGDVMVTTEKEMARYWVIVGKLSGQCRMIRRNEFMHLSGDVYHVDCRRSLCSCPGFTMGHTAPCKHLKALKALFRSGKFGKMVLPMYGNSATMVQVIEDQETMRQWQRDINSYAKGDI